MLNKTVLAGSILVAAAAIAPTAPARALCAAPENEAILGMWRNVNANTRGITQLEIDYVCDDVRLCPEGGECSQVGAGYVVRAWGACSPTDCEWGATEADYRDSTAHLTAVFDPGFAEKILSIRITEDGQLAATNATLYASGDDRDSYSATYFFEKE